MSNDPDLIYRLEDCRDCQGTGVEPNHGPDYDYERCLMCDGTGEVDPAEVWAETFGNGMGERCYRPGCRGWITGASDFCSPECEAAR